VERLLLIIRREWCPRQGPARQERPLIGRERDEFDRATAIPRAKRGSFLLGRSRELVRRRRVELEHGSLSSARGAGEHVPDKTTRQRFAYSQPPPLGTDGNRSRELPDPLVISGCTHRHQVRVETWLRLSGLSSL
jgi:hypothetical protein